MYGTYYGRSADGKPNLEHRLGTAAHSAFGGWNLIWRTRYGEKYDCLSHPFNREDVGDKAGWGISHWSWRKVAREELAAAREELEDQTGGFRFYCYANGIDTAFIADVMSTFKVTPWEVVKRHILTLYQQRKIDDAVYTACARYLEIRRACDSVYDYDQNLQRALAPPRHHPLALPPHMPRKQGVIDLSRYGEVVDRVTETLAMVPRTSGGNVVRYDCCLHDRDGNVSETFVLKTDDMSPAQRDAAQSVLTHLRGDWVPMVTRLAAFATLMALLPQAYAYDDKNKFHPNCVRGDDGYCGSPEKAPAVQALGAITSYLWSYFCPGAGMEMSTELVVVKPWAGAICKYEVIPRVAETVTPFLVFVVLALWFCYPIFRSLLPNKKAVDNRLRNIAGSIYVFFCASFSKLVAAFGLGMATACLFYFFTSRYDYALILSPSLVYARSVANNYYLDHLYNTSMVAGAWLTSSVGELRYAHNPKAPLTKSALHKGTICITVKPDISTLVGNAFLRNYNGCVYLVTPVHVLRALEGANGCMMGPSLQFMPMTNRDGSKLVPVTVSNRDCAIFNLSDPNFGMASRLQAVAFKRANGNELVNAELQALSHTGGMLSFGVLRSSEVLAKPYVQFTGSAQSGTSGAPIVTAAGLLAGMLIGCVDLDEGSPVNVVLPISAIDAQLDGLQTRGLIRVVSGNEYSVSDPLDVIPEEARYAGVPSAIVIQNILARGISGNPNSKTTVIAKAFAQAVLDGYMEGGDEGVALVLSNLTTEQEVILKQHCRGDPADYVSQQIAYWQSSKKRRTSNSGNLPDVGESAVSGFVKKGKLASMRGGSHRHGADSSTGETTDLFNPRYARRSKADPSFPATFTIAQPETPVIPDDAVELMIADIKKGCVINTKQKSPLEGWTSIGKMGAVYGSCSPRIVMGEQHPALCVLLEPLVPGFTAQHMPACDSPTVRLLLRDFGTRRNEITSRQTPYPAQALKYAEAMVMKRYAGRFETWKPHTAREIVSLYLANCNLNGAVGNTIYSVAKENREVRDNPVLFEAVVRLVDNGIKLFDSLVDEDVELSDEAAVELYKLGLMAIYRVFPKREFMRLTKSGRAIFGGCLVQQILFYWANYNVLDPLTEIFNTTEDPLTAVGAGHHDEGIERLGQLFGRWFERIRQHKTAAVLNSDIEFWDGSVPVELTKSSNRVLRDFNSDAPSCQRNVNRNLLSMHGRPFVCDARGNVYRIDVGFNVYSGCLITLPANGWERAISCFAITYIVEMEHSELPKIIGTPLSEDQVNQGDDNSHAVSCPEIAIFQEQAHNKYGPPMKPGSISVSRTNVGFLGVDFDFVDGAVVDGVQTKRVSACLTGMKKTLAHFVHNVTTVPLKAVEFTEQFDYVMRLMDPEVWLRVRSIVAAYLLTKGIDINVGAANITVKDEVRFTIMQNAKRIGPKSKKQQQPARRDAASTTTTVVTKVVRPKPVARSGSNLNARPNVSLDAFGNHLKPGINSRWAPFQYDAVPGVPGWELGDLNADHVGQVIKFGCRATDTDTFGRFAAQAHDYDFIRWTGGHITLTLKSIATIADGKVLIAFIPASERRKRTPEGDKVPYTYRALLNTAYKKEGRIKDGQISLSIRTADILARGPRKGDWYAGTPDTADPTNAVSPGSFYVMFEDYNPNIAGTGEAADNALSRDILRVYASWAGVLLNRSIDAPADDVHTQMDMVTGVNLDSHRFTKAFEADMMTADMRDRGGYDSDPQLEADRKTLNDSPGGLRVGLSLIAPVAATIFDSLFPGAGVAAGLAFSLLDLGLAHAGLRDAVTDVKDGYVHTYASVDSGALDDVRIRHIVVSKELADEWRNGGVPMTVEDMAARYFANLAQFTACFTPPYTASWTQFIPTHMFFYAYGFTVLESLLPTFNIPAVFFNSGASATADVVYRTDNIGSRPSVNPALTLSFIGGDAITPSVSVAPGVVKTYVANAYPAYLNRSPFAQSQSEAQYPVTIAAGTGTGSAPTALYLTGLSNRTTAWHPRSTFPGGALECGIRATDLMLSTIRAASGSAVMMNSLGTRVVGRNNEAQKYSDVFNLEEN
jgi:hypothetical protein